MKPHKHAELIKAWADGAEIEERYIGNGDYEGSEWYDLTGDWSDTENWEYRIKPEPKPDVVEYWKHTLTHCYGVDDDEDATLKLTFDGETGELKSAEVLK